MIRSQLPGEPCPWSDGLSAAFHAVPRGREAAVAWAAEVGADVPLPGGGETRARWEALDTVGAEDLVSARVIEPHVDALAILAEAGLTAAPGLYGVWAAEGPLSTAERINSISLNRFAMRCCSAWNVARTCPNWTRCLR